MMSLGAWSYFMPNRLLLAVFGFPDCESFLFRSMKCSWPYLVKICLLL